MKCSETGARFDQCFWVLRSSIIKTRRELSFQINSEKKKTTRGTGKITSQPTQHKHYFWCHWRWTIFLIYFSQVSLRSVNLGSVSTVSKEANQKQFPSKSWICWAVHLTGGKADGPPAMWPTNTKSASGDPVWADGSLQKHPPLSTHCFRRHGLHGCKQCSGWADWILSHLLSSFPVSNNGKIFPISSPCAWDCESFSQWRSLTAMAGC